jgi:hypothetical protein
MAMENGLPKLVTVIALALLIFSSLVALPARAQVLPASSYGQFTPEPVWATVNADAKGNYLGGNEIFDVFVVDAALPPEGNVTVFNMTITAPAFPVNAQSNFAPGLPVMLAPGDSILATIALPIPSDFKANNFTANLVMATQLFNGTREIPLKITGTVQVFILGLPVTGTTQTTTQASGTQTTPQSGTVSTTLFAVGVAVPSIVAVVLLILLVQARGRPKPAGT